MPSVVTFPQIKPARHHPSRRKFASARAIFALMLREMSTSYGRSAGGYIWAILEPAAAIALLTAIFSIGFRAPPLGNDFAIFYATGIVPFLMFNHVSSSVAAAINYSKALLAYPSVTFVDAIIARFILNLITQILVAAVIFSGLHLILDAPLSVDVLVVLQTFLFCACLALGIGTLNCFLASMFPVWQRVWSVISRPLFLISGIIFILEIVPQPYRDYLWWNPLVHIISLMRSGFYAGYDAPWISPVFIMLISGICLTLGLIFLLRYHRDILQN